MLTKEKGKADTLGALASGLCMVHCLATPFLFVASACASDSHCCAASPSWWRLVDAALLLVSLFAVYWAVRNSSKRWVQVAMVASWLFLATIILNAQLQLFPLAEFWIYVPALSLVILHVINHRHCTCDDDKCCAT